MLATIIYILALMTEIGFLIFFSVFVVFLIYSSLKGSPFVPTNSKEIDDILKGASLKHNQNFYELGCGEGRVTIRAVTKYQVKGYGIDVNPILIRWANFKVFLKKMDNVEFYRKNIFDVSLEKADVIYLFLMPALISKLVPKFKKELRKKTLIISHGFKVKGFGPYLVKFLDRRPFPTYYYIFRPKI